MVQALVSNAGSNVSDEAVAAFAASLNVHRSCRFAWALVCWRRRPPHARSNTVESITVTPTSPRRFAPKGTLNAWRMDRS